MRIIEGDLSDIDAEAECYVMSLFGRVPVEIKYVVRIDKTISLFIGGIVDGAKGKLFDPVAGDEGKG